MWLKLSIDSKQLPLRLVCFFQNLIGAEALFLIYELIKSTIQILPKLWVEVSLGQGEWKIYTSFPSTTIMVILSIVIKN
jgi:hypothetical protein